MRLRPMRTCLLCLCLLCLLGAGSALAEDPLQPAELTDWLDWLWTDIRQQPARNDPALTHDPQGDDTWLYEYAFGVVEASEGTLQGEENPIVEVEILTDAVACPRGLRVGDGVDAVLAAYPSENAALTGDEGQAVLYVQPLAEGGEGWGRVLRRNQALEGVEYGVAVPTQGMEDFREVLTLLYVITDGQVSAIRASGFGQLVAQAESDANLETLRSAQKADAFTPVQASVSSEWKATEITFGNLSFAQATPEGVIQALGTPHADEETQEITYTLRTLLYPYAMFEFVKEEQTWQLEAVLVSDSGLEGPKGLRIGDTQQSVLQRFGEGNDDDENLMYTVTDEQGNTYALSCSFFDGVLTEYLLYRI